MRYQPDLIIKGADESVLGIVEVKDRSSPVGYRYQFAEIRSQFSKFDHEWNIKYFIIVTRNVVAIWHKDFKIQDDLAVFEFNPNQCFKDKLSNGEQPLDFVAFEWLDRLAHGIDAGGFQDKIFKDFENDIRGGQILFGDQS